MERVVMGELTVLDYVIFLTGLIYSITESLQRADAKARRDGYPFSWKIYWVENRFAIFNSVMGSVVLILALPTFVKIKTGIDWDPLITLVIAVWPVYLMRRIKGNVDNKLRVQNSPTVSECQTETVTQVTEEAQTIEKC
jgi:hypothetical protein